MPPLIATILVAVLDITYASALAVAYVLTSIGASIILGAVNKLLTKSATSSSLSSTVASRSIATRQVQD